MFSIILPNDRRPKLVARAKEIIQQLNALLGVNERVGNRYSRLPISNLVTDFIEALKRGDCELAEVVLRLLGKLVEDLERIKQFDRKLFRHYKRRMATANEPTFRGLRFEMGTASSFVKRGVPFSAPIQGKLSRPDFVVQSPNGECYVECTVREVSSNTNPDLLSKIGSAISEKSKKAYADPNTILFLESTDLVYARMEGEHILNNPNLRNDVAQLLKIGPLGSVVLIFYVLEDGLIAGKSYSRLYLRCDNNAVGKNALWFLEKYYPRSEGKSLLNYAVASTP